MAWIFVCDRCKKASVDEGFTRRNGEHSGTLVLDSKGTPQQEETPERIKLELCAECWNNLDNWLAGVDTIILPYSSIPLASV